MYIQTHTLLSLTGSAQIYQLLKKNKNKNADSFEKQVLLLN